MNTLPAWAGTPGTLSSLPVGWHGEPRPGSLAQPERSEGGKKKPNETEKEKKWGWPASSRRRHSNCRELTAGGSCQGDGRFPPRRPFPRGPREDASPSPEPRCGQATHSWEIRTKPYTQEKSGVLGTELHVPLSG